MDLAARPVRGPIHPACRRFGAASTRIRLASFTGPGTITGAGAVTTFGGRTYTRLGAATHRTSILITTHRRQRPPGLARALTPHPTRRNAPVPAS
ncbi:hypothetical protein M2359_001993 [Gordonia amarae]|uniref:Uncharacterized protein n=1 Tax=Gordonia amarae NBRC 15530 TaxID=1075090 RepID=G7GRA4_9ACTN|nr:hypothetical protein [Gordonia amarae]MCS3878364.1 hypothetical protein [Gordonia amarae]GAB06129.1 hypothetical protein GOAMR_48_00390 [Gordonia amarae NBRC 15530]